MGVQVEWIDSVSPASIGNKIYRDDVEIADVANGIQIYQDDEAPSSGRPKYEVQTYDAEGNETTLEIIGENTDYIDLVPSTQSYVFPGTANSNMMTTYDCVPLINGLAVVFKGKWDLGKVGYNTILGFTNGELSVNNDSLFISLTGLSIQATWANDGLEHTFVLNVDETNGHTFYVDGVAQGTAVASQVSFGADSFFEVGSWRGGQNLLGSLSHVYLYTRPFTTQEIADVSADITNIPADSQAVILADNKVLNTWTDDSGNGNDATNAGDVTLA